jgi:hypothetical protein
MKWVFRASVMGLMLVAVSFLLFLPSTPVSAQAQFGTNWIGQFFNSSDLSGTVVATASYPNGLNQQWGITGPKDGSGVIVPGVNIDNFSARFSSTQTLTAGTYTFIATYDDGLRLSINGQIVIDDFLPGALRSKQATVAITGGVYSFVVDYLETTSEATIQVSWLTSNTTTTPTGPTATVVPPATGSVEGVNGLSLRTGPYLGGSLVGVIRPGTTYDVLAKNNNEGIFTWYLIKVSDTKQGWVSGRYFTVTGNVGVVPEIRTVFDEVDGAPELGVVGVTRSVMNMRVRPSKRTGLITQLAWGAEVSIIGRTRQGGRDFWYQIRVNGTSGWILAAFVRVRGNLDSVPVR